MGGRVIAGWFLSAGALWGGPVYDYTVIAQPGQVVAGQTLTALNLNYGGVGLAPDNNFVAYLANYSGSGTGIFGSNNTLEAYLGEQIGGLTVHQFLYGPYANDSGHVLFDAYTPGELSLFTDTSVLLAGSSSLQASTPMILTNTGDFLSLEENNNGVVSIIDSAGLVDSINPAFGVPQLGQVAGNQVGGAAYIAGSNNTLAIHAGDGTVIAQVGSVIGGHTISYLGAGNSYFPSIAINDSGLIAFFAEYDGSNCGIFTQNGLAIAIPASQGSCIVSRININDQGTIAYLQDFGNLYTQYGLVATGVAVSPEFLNNLGSLAFVDSGGRLELATDVSAPEPATWLLAMCGIAVVLGLRNSRTSN